MTYCGCTRFGFVLEDKDDQLEEVACPGVDPVHRMEAGKMTACYCCTFLARVFWAIFRQGRVALDLNLLVVLRRVRWK